MHFQSRTDKIKTWITEEVPVGLLSMPHGYGFSYPNHSEKTTGALVNVLTSSDECDPLAKTPYHKNVRVRIEKIFSEVFRSKTKTDYARCQYDNYFYSSKK